MIFLSIVKNLYITGLHHDDLHGEEDSDDRADGIEAYLHELEVHDNGGMDYEPENTEYKPENTKYESENTDYELQHEHTEYEPKWHDKREISLY